MDYILTRAILFGDKDEVQRRTRIQNILAAFGLPPISDWTPRGTVEAEINHGRWIARCQCGGAECVDPDWPFLVCCSCGAGPQNIRFPRDRKQIESELLKRPDRTTRNWRPGETLADLRQENAEHGITQEVAS